MSCLKTILVVDDNSVNRTILLKILSQEYNVIEAKNGEIALQLLDEHFDSINAVLLDIVMPVMNGYDVLKSIQNTERYNNLPIVVITADSNIDSEIKALTLGAWDFVTKPYNAEIIKFRLKNAIERSGLSAFNKIKYLLEYDALTGIFNKMKFFDATRKMIDANCDESFVFLRFDVDRFQLINSFFGVDEGDNLLKYIAARMQEDAKLYNLVTYGRIESDIFAFCVPYEKTAVENMVKQAKKTLAKYNPNYDIVPSIGIYLIEDKNISVEEMYNRATLAAKICKGNYVDFYAYYNTGMRDEILREQDITNEMNFALENEQFEIYLQPKYNIHTNLPSGAEVLVRWNHPKKGLLVPSLFVPLFERNGFITKLDYYVWEQACKLISSWKEKGVKPFPISVNVSRVNFYNPKLSEIFTDLVKKYNIEPEMLNLEITESAYTDNPVTMKKTMSQLQNNGFLIMMDDFGSGYSSLSLLKDISVDLLKIDMHFLTNTEIPGRGENIIASVIRMAKWLNIPVIAEGAETLQQVDFLRSVGCDFVQGFYFAQPMTIREYEHLSMRLLLSHQILEENSNKNFCYNDLFFLNPEMKQSFDSTLQAAVIYEFSDNNVEIVRVNEAYFALLGHEDMLAKEQNLLMVIEDEFKASALKAFSTCVSTKKTTQCDYKRHSVNGKPIWIHTMLKYISNVGDKHILVGELTDITMRRELDTELQKYKSAWKRNNKGMHTILIVDDAAINRIVLKKILCEKFAFLEAENGEKAISILKQNPNQVDIILLDIGMPVMDGKEFLQYKKTQSELDAIPVIMITADDSQEQQISTFSLGADDYIVKPFIPEVVTRRVANVLESNRRFQKMVEEYNDMSQQAKTDSMTGLINRASAEEMMSQRLLNATDICAMIMLDIDNFKSVNDTYGHSYGDKVICAIADKLRNFVQADNIVARMGGDEFAVFVGDIADIKQIENNAFEFCASTADIIIDGKTTDITCSIGIAITSEQINTFDTLYKSADKALYSAKCQGRNTVSVYGNKSADTLIAKWINDAQSVFDIINDSIYACNKDTYELLYINENLCNAMGITQKSCTGKKCYEALMNRNSPCEFCSLPKMTDDKVYTRIFKHPTNQQVYLLRGKNIDQNGIMVHLELAVDVSRLENINSYIEETNNYETR